MKKCTSAMVAGLAALAIASSASAQTNVIRITGSTAFRKAAHAAIKNLLVNTGSLAYVWGYSGTDASGEAIAEFRGTTVTGGLLVDIKTSFAGSVGGVQSVTQARTDGANAAYLNATTQVLTTGGTPSITEVDSGAPDITLSDTFQGTTPFTTPTMAEHVVGVIAFRWVRGVEGNTNVNNVTDCLLRTLYGTGQIPLSIATGSHADEGALITAFGRDEDSGTRYAAFADTQFGVFTPPLQYQVVGTIGSNGNATAIQAWPASTILGTLYPAGHPGYAGGGDLAKALATPGLGAQAGTAIGYLSTGDAATAVGLGSANAIPSKFLTYNGTDYTTANVTEGLYQFWAYEHLYYLPTLTGAKKTFADQLVTQIHNTDATASGIKVTDMQVGRAGDGNDVTFGNGY